MYIYLILFLCFFSNLRLVIAQEDRVFQVLGLNTKSPVSYANVQIKNTGLGTYTNEQGKFILAFTRQDTLLISSVGYEKATIPAASMQEVIIHLKEKPTLLREIVIRPKQGISSSSLGYFNKKKQATMNIHIMSRANDAVLIENTPQQNNLLITSLNLSIKKENKDGAILAVHLYSVKDGQPHEDLISEVLTFRQTDISNKNEIQIDISNYHILLPKDGVFVSVECLGFINTNTGLFYSNAREISQKFTHPPIITFIKDSKVKNLGFIKSSGTWQENTYLRKEGKSIYPAFGITVVEVDEKK